MHKVDDEMMLDVSMSFTVCIVLKNGAIAVTAA
jgi:hypothetical protein